MYIILPRTTLQFKQKKKIIICTKGERICLSENINKANENINIKKKFLYEYLSIPLRIIFFVYENIRSEKNMEDENFL
jgi:hypothetical protein